MSFLSFLDPLKTWAARLFGRAALSEITICKQNYGNSGILLDKVKCRVYISLCSVDGSAASPFDLRQDPFVESPGNRFSAGFPMRSEVRMRNGGK